MRRTVLLPRDTNVQITKHHAAALNAAHESALRGASWEWGHAQSSTVTMCALLAGVAILLNRDGDVRKDDAFAGRVALPFLETLPPARGQPRLALLPGTGDWVVWRQTASGATDVLLRKPGHDGFLDAVLIFTSLLKF